MRARYLRIGNILPLYLIASPILWNSLVTCDRSSHFSNSHTGNTFYYKD